mgnify:CR=1 FL=1
MAVIDVAGFVADLKDHAVEHGFHVHDERHFVESYSLRQNWEVDMHPEEGCDGPVDLYLSLEIDPRVLLGFEDAVIAGDGLEDPPDEFHLPLSFTWALPPLPRVDCVWTPCDQMIMPASTAVQPGSTGHRLDAVGHVGLVNDPRAWAVFQTALAGSSLSTPRRI